MKLLIYSANSHVIDRKVWKKVFYRFLDGYKDDASKRETLSSIERRIFYNIKPEVELETGEWRGTVEQNRIADQKVADSIMNSFRSYEEGMQRKGHFFNFRRK